MNYEFNTIEDCMDIIEKRNDIPYEIKIEIEDIWFDILMDEEYEDDFRIEKAIRKLNDFINMEKEQGILEYIPDILQILNEGDIPNKIEVE